MPLDAPAQSVRAERLARRRDVRAVPRRPVVGERELAGVLRRLPERPRPARSRPDGRRARYRPHAAAAAARRRRPPPRPQPSPAGRPPPSRRRHRRRRGRAPPRPPSEPLRGAAARIVANMEASLDVPTATSFRDVPAKLLEVNRQVINGYLGRTRGGKVSFTHLIGYAVVRAIADTCR